MMKKNSISSFARHIFVSLFFLIAVGGFIFTNTTPLPAFGEASEDSFVSQCGSLQDEESPVLIGGYAWNSYLGWINQRDQSKKPCGVEKVTRQEQEEIIGWSWSPTYGWICWGTTCADTNTLPINKYGAPGSACNGGPFHVTLDRTDVDVPKLDGCAKIIGLKEKGTILFSGTYQNSSGATQQYGVRYDRDRAEFYGWAWSSSVGWIAFSARTLWDTPLTPPCPNDTKVCVDSTGAKVCKSSCGDSETAQACPAILDQVKQTCASGFCANQVCLSSASAVPSLIGKYPHGRACDPYCDKNVIERDNNRVISLWKTSYLDGKAILTRGGKLYAKDGATDSDIDADNDILRGGAAKSLTAATSSRDGHIIQLRNEFGSINIEALTTSTGLTREDKNAFGKKVITVTQGPVLQRNANAPCDVVGIENSPEGRLFHYLKYSFGDTSIFSYKGNLTIGDYYSLPCGQDGWMIANAVQGYSGAKTVVVQGDLIIKTPVIYEASQSGLSNLKQLASIAWIAYKNPDGTGGNIIIDKCVPPSPRANVDQQKYFTEIDGVFVAEGKIQVGEGRDCATTLQEIPEKLSGESVKARTIADSKKKIALRVDSSLCADANGLCADDKCKNDKADRGGATCMQALQREKDVRSARQSLSSIKSEFSATLDKNCDGESTNKKKTDCRVEKQSTNRTQVLPKIDELEKKKGEAQQVSYKLYRDCKLEYADCKHDVYVSCVNRCSRKGSSCGVDVCKQSSGCTNYQACIDAQGSYGRADTMEQLANKYTSLEPYFSQDMPLHINGILMAHQFIMNRKYIAAKNDGSEVIQNDGRYIVNTPPGLENLARSLPAW